MKHGFIRVAAASPRVTVADTKANAAAIFATCEKAYADGVKLIVFPELSITGATCGDLFCHMALQKAAEDAILHLCEATADMDMLIAVGAPLRLEAKLYNCAVILHRGMIVGVVPKTHLHPSERRQFADASAHAAPAGASCAAIRIGEGFVPFGTKLLFGCEGMPELRIAFEIGEDLCAPIPMSSRHAMAGADVICCLSSVPETVGAAQYRRNLVKLHSMQTTSGYVMAVAGYGESTTDAVYGGHCLIAERGRLLAEAKPFESQASDRAFANGYSFSEIDVQMLLSERMKSPCFGGNQADYCELTFEMEQTDTPLSRLYERMPFVPTADADRSSRCEEILTIQATGLKKRMEHTHARSAVIGISGGLDSCLALLVSVRAMDMLSRPRTDIIAVTMPCFGTTQRTRTNAEILCERLGVTFRCVDIKAAVQQHFADIGHDESIKNVVYENVQARERTQVIMDIANAAGGMVIGTGDLSELVLGWATYNGDHMSMYGVNAGVPKTLIRHIVRCFADTCNDEALAKVLLDILDTPVSPELLPADDNDEIAQKTEDLVGPYALHDFYLYHFLRFGFSPDKIERIANHAFAGEYDGETIHKWLGIFMRRFFTQQFKRSCLPDGPKVGSVGVSPRGDLVMPSDASYAEFLI